jgi:hypothetical protein
MSKKRGKKRVNSSKKGKKFFLFNGNVTNLVLTFVFLALVFLLPFMTTGNTVNSSMTGYAPLSTSNNVLDKPVTWGWLNSVEWLGIGNTWKELIVYVITLLIIFVMLFDILSLVSIFSQWVSGVIAGGMAIVAALIGFIRIITTWFITIGATMGVAAGFLEIGVAIVIFVGLIFGSSRIALFAAKRKAQREIIAGIKGASEAEGAITGLRRIQRRFRSKP